MSRLAWPILPLLLAACGGGGPLDLQITFPDAAARASTARVVVWVLEPSGGASCAALMDGSAQPGSEGYTVEVQRTIAFPPEPPPEPLRDVGPGPRLFAAEGQDGARRVFLRGCLAVEAGGDGPGVVVIALQRVATCVPTGPERCNGQDDDCDGQTDNGSPEDLCPALPNARATACLEGECEYQCVDDWVDTNPESDPFDGCECQPTNNGIEICDGLDNDCDGVTDGAGTPCDDGAACTENDQCDAAGVCRGSPIAGYCGVSEECLPACAASASGCARRPDYLALNCPAEASRETPASCTLTAVSAPGTEGCARCEVTLLPSRLYTHTFGTWDGCDQADWTFAASGCSSSAYCNLTDASQACCQEYACSAADEGMSLSTQACGLSQLRGFRLERLFDLQPWERVRACQQLKQSPRLKGGVFQIQVDPGDDPLGTLVHCLSPGSFGEQDFSAPCAELPRVATDWPQTRLGLRVELERPQPGETLAVVLGQLNLYGFPAGCTEEVEMVRTRFDSCPGDTNTWEGWSSYTGDIQCTQGPDCSGNGLAGGGLLVREAAQGGPANVSLSRSLTGPHRDFKLPAELCWTESSLGAIGSYRFSLSGGGGGVWYVILSETPVEFATLGNPRCRRLCVDLGDFAANVSGAEFAELGLQAEVNLGSFALNDIELRHARACPAQGVIELGPLTGGSPAELSVTNLLSQPRRARVECVWGDGHARTAREIEFR
jgi:hypothetical protein